MCFETTITLIARTISGHNNMIISMLTIDFLYQSCTRHMFALRTFFVLSYWTPKVTVQAKVPTLTIIVCNSVYFWLIRSFTDPAFTGSIFVCGPLHHHVLLSSIFWSHRSFQIRYAAHFLHGLAMIFLRDSLCLSADFLTPQWHDILDFSNCPLSRVLHVTLASWQVFWIWVSSEVITIWVSVWISVDQLNTS